MADRPNFDAESARRVIEQFTGLQTYGARRVRRFSRYKCVHYRVATSLGAATVDYYIGGPWKGHIAYWTKQRPDRMILEWWGYTPEIDVRAGQQQKAV